MTMSCTSCGWTSAHTEITPEPPSDRMGTTMSSLPEYMRKSSERYCATVLAYEMLPEASLMPMTLGCVQRRATLCSEMEQPVRPGML